ncbi:MAG: holo-ACP synthase [Dehalococcoidia bacterium]
MPYAVGIDLLAISRLQRVLDKHAGRFLKRCYTPEEVAYCRGRVQELAARFAAKEAVMKALGTGIRGVGWRDIEVLPDRRGKPLVYLYGRAKERAERIGLVGLDVSLTHERDFAVAAVVGMREDEVEDPQESRERLVRRLKERGLL